MAVMSKNPISIEALETLDAIERRGSFAKAAEELNKATSALSYIVQRLEEQLDVALFQRQGRRSVLTPAGRVVLEDGRTILEATRTLASRAKETATGWETHIRIAIESTLSYPAFFALLNQFVDKHPGIELDITECVLNGGWEALESDRTDLIVGAPGPAPLHKGFRTISLPTDELIPVISSKHRYAKLAQNQEALEDALPKLRRVITHDTSDSGVKRHAGLSRGSKKLYVQTIDQKLAAILAGTGIGHLPRARVKTHLANKELLELNLPTAEGAGNYMAWKISNKGKGLRALTDMISERFSE